MSRVVLVEDDEHLAEGLVFNLRNSGYEVEHFETGEEAIQDIEQHGCDLILLDLMLPGMGGLDVARHLRRGGDTTPIIMLTARRGENDAVAGLNAGADDYVTKPFDLDEVLARIRGTLRRQSWTHAADPGGDAAPDHLQYGAWRIEFSKFAATDKHGKEKRLTVTEAAMLKLFAQRPGEVISRQTFLEEVWGWTGSHETRTVDNFIRRLRATLEADPKHPAHIVSVRSAGYKFVP